MPERDISEIATEHAEAFEALGDETRLGILLAMAYRQWSEGPLSYVEAMDAAGVEDSGRFNYHLGKLSERFVMAEDERYVPTSVVHDLVSLVLSGRLVDDATVGPKSVGGACTICGTPLVAQYDYNFDIVCPNCENSRFSRRLAPAVARERDLRVIAHESDRAVREKTTMLRRGNCPVCGGETRTHYRPCEEFAYMHPDIEVFVIVGCERCYHGVPTQSVGQFLLGHPEVREYAHEHDIDLQERPVWEYVWARTGLSTTVRSREPWDIEKLATVDGCRLVVVFEDDGDIGHIDHVPIDPDRLDDPETDTARQNGD